MPLSCLRPTYVPSTTASSSTSSSLLLSAAGRIADLIKILAPLDQVFRSDSRARFYVNSLRKCLRFGDHRTVGSLHARLISRGFESDLLLSNVLMDMYAKLELMNSCSKLFDGMNERDLISWCTLISGFVRDGASFQAYSAFRQMLRIGWIPNHFVVSSVLNACSTLGILQPGLLVHGFIVKSGLGFDRFVEVGLVNLYARYGDLDCALKLFYEIPVKNLVTWNAMISGYFLNDFLIQAVELCRDMCRVGFVMDSVTLRVVMAAASALQNLELCQNLHVYSIKVGLDSDSFVVVELVKLLTELGDVDYMRKLHRKIKRPDVSLYSLLISGYHFCGCREEAVNLAEELLNLNASMKEGAFVNVLRLCFCKEEGTQVHAKILKTGHLSYLPVGNALISLYARFGDLFNAKLAFDNMRAHDVVSWTAIMAGLVQNLLFFEAIEVFSSFRSTGKLLDNQCLVTSINACTGLRDVVIGSQIHCLALKHGLGLCNYMNASMIDMYAKLGYISSSARLFSYLLPPHSPILINVMLSGYCWNSQPEKAIDLFGREYRLGFVPDRFSYSTILSACANVQFKKVGEQFHCCTVKTGFELSDVVVGNAIINLYVKCECMASACKFFYNMKNWNAYSCMALMLGYIENGRSESQKVYSQMQQSGLQSEPISFARVAVDLGRQIHGIIVKIGLDSDANIRDAFVGAYEKSLNADKLKEASDFMSEREDEKQDYVFAGFIENANAGWNLKAFGLYNVDKLRKGTYSSEHWLNYYSDDNYGSQMHENHAPLHMMNKGFICDEPKGSLVDAHTKYIIHDNNSGVLQDILGSKVVLSNLYDSHQSSDLRELIRVESAHDRTTMLVLLGQSQLGILDERMDYFVSAKKTLDGGNGRVPYTG
ncbi:pentatricopeptide repeat-containing protein At3g20730-like isoform X2 [Zingiber officinale]|uniref:pentatricopeptide repeat-containing protein At3g20730-like isoform X2 n=1 Tax=Zingiber officinale TaxID=94328 RepID=UPI001C4A9F3C|nr:pentatricopeptide repeat-containing protein At3g20730-like isoform X2 [Zingiber officinale]